MKKDLPTLEAVDSDAALSPEGPSLRRKTGMASKLRAKLASAEGVERPVLLQLKLQHKNGKLIHRTIDLTRLLPEMEAIVEGYTIYVPYLRDATDCIKYLIWLDGQKRPW